MRGLTLCARYGHQSFREMTGHPMSIVDFTLFTQCLIELYNHEVKPSEMGLPTSED